ncbi:MAG TPA: aldo/keto reductase [Anaeromyxobacteraceae bacterium]|nr:aldo/keto reductase [Anaeromyxobacteraceae bacterium]
MCPLEERSGSEADRFGETLYDPMAEADRRVLAAVDALARARSLPHAQVALAWLLRRDVATAPIVGATRMEHLEGAGGLGVQLSEEEVAALEAPYLPHPVAGFG